MSRPLSRIASTQPVVGVRSQQHRAERRGDALGVYLSLPSSRLCRDKRRYDPCCDAPRCVGSSESLRWPPTLNTLDLKGDLTHADDRKEARELHTSLPTDSPGVERLDERAKPEPEKGQRPSEVKTRNARVHLTRL